MTAQTARFQFAFNIFLVSVRNALVLPTSLWFSRIIDSCLARRNMRDSGKHARKRAANTDRPVPTQYRARHE